MSGSKFLFNALLDTVWRENSSHLRLIRTIFVINYPLAVMFVFANLESWLAALMGPALLLPLQIFISAVIAEPMALLLGRIKGLEKGSDEYHEFRLFGFDQMMSRMPTRIAFSITINFVVWMIVLVWAVTLF